MTIGSIDTMGSYSAGPTDCSSNDLYPLGKTISWSGVDSPQVKQKRNQWVKKLMHVRDRVYYRRVYSHGRVVKRRFVEPVYKWVRILANAAVAVRPKLSQNNTYSKSWSLRSGYKVERSSTVFPLQTCAYLRWIPEEIQDTWGPDDEYKLISRLQARMTGSDFNLASFIGAEGIDTIDSIATAAARIGRSLHALKRGDLPTALRVLTAGSRPPSSSFRKKELRTQLEVYDEILRRERSAVRWNKHQDGWLALTASHYLEYHLAVEPLLGDVKSAAEKLAHLVETPRRKIYHCSVNKRINRKPDPNIWGRNYWKIMRRVHKVKLYHYVETFPSNVALTGLFDPEVVIWNAIPLSFVVDWFLPIGNYLEASAFAAKLQGSYLRCELINREFREPSHRYDGAGRLEILTANAANGPTHWVDGTFTRTKPAILGVPLPKLKPLGVFSNWQRMATAVSLIVSFQSGMERKKG